MITMNVGQIILSRPWLFNKNITIYGQSNMCEGKQINLLSLRPKTSSLSKHLLWLCCQPQLLQLFHLSLLLFLLYLPLVMHIMSINRPLLPTPSHYKTFKFALTFVSHEYMHKLHKEICDGNKWSNVKPTLRTGSRKIFKTFNVSD